MSPGTAPHWTNAYLCFLSARCTERRGASPNCCLHLALVGGGEQEESLASKCANPLQSAIVFPAPGRHPAHRCKQGSPPPASAQSAIRAEPGATASRSFLRQFSFTATGLVSTYGSPPNRNAQARPHRPNTGGISFSGDPARHAALSQTGRHLDGPVGGSKCTQQAGKRLRSVRRCRLSQGHRQALRS